MACRRGVYQKKVFCQNLVVPMADRSPLDHVVDDRYDHRNRLQNAADHYHHHAEDDRAAVQFLLRQFEAVHYEADPNAVRQIVVRLRTFSRDDPHRDASQRNPALSASQKAVVFRTIRHLFQTAADRLGACLQNGHLICRPSVDYLADAQARIPYVSGIHRREMDLRTACDYLDDGRRWAQPVCILRYLPPDDRHCEEHLRDRGLP